MSPADGADFTPPEMDVAVLHDARAILLHGGRALILLELADGPLPGAGVLLQDGAETAWTAESWRVANGETAQWCGLALLDVVPAAGAQIRDAASFRRWHLASAPQLDIAPEPLVELVRRVGLDTREVFGFLVKHLLAGRPRDTAEAQAHRAFARSFVTAAAEPDGFIEILGLPDTGGLFAQGWSMSLGAGATTLATMTDDLGLRQVEVALFDREDILPPGHGFCLIAKDWREQSLAAVDAVFFEKDGRLLRLDVVRGAVLQLSDVATTAHVADMLPRLRGLEGTLAAMKRVCRPRYHGIDSLSGTALPIAAAFDAVLRAPDGTLLVLGWLLDPLRRIERVLIKSTANLYARLETEWSPLPRPDLNAGFAADPRFTQLLDEREVMHGFIGHAPARPGQTEGAEVYLELVLDDGSCLFRPLSVTPFESAERLPQIVGGLSPHDPELARIVTDHLAPFLASVEPTSRARGRGAARPIPLGRHTGAREVSAVIPFRSFAELQPMFALLSGTPEAEALELALVTSRKVASEVLERLTDAFRFYRLSGSLVIASEHETLAGQLDLGVAATAGARVLCWTPAALPREPGWLARMTGEMATLPVPGLISPALVYEDGSIYFGGECGDPSDEVCALSGYGAEWLHRGAPKLCGTGAAELAMIDRDALTRVGGFSGHLFSDRYGHVDLADRLCRAGLATWCSGAVAFWMLDDHQAADAGPFARLMQQVDAALLERRSSLASGESVA